MFLLQRRDEDTDSRDSTLKITSVTLREAAGKPALPFLDITLQPSTGRHFSS